MSGSEYQWSTDPSLNQTADNIDWTEGATQPSQVNNNVRQQMARRKEVLSDLGGISTTGGTNDAYTLTIQAQIDPAQGYFNGLVFGFVADRANGGPATINITPQGLTALGPTPLKALSGRELAAGELQEGGYYVAHHDGTQAVLAGSVAGIVTIDRLSADVRGRLQQVGDIKPWFTDTIPDGWLLLDGSTYSRTLPLFGTWGTIFGPGNGTTTADLLDMRGQFLRGLDPTGTVDPDVSGRTDRGDGTTGANPGTGQGDALDDHTHSDNISIANAGNHAHGPAGGGNFITNQSDSGPLQTAGGGPVAYQGQTGATTTTGNHIHTVNGRVNNVDAGADVSTETRPVNIACNWIVLADAEAAAGDLTLSRTSGHYYTFDDSVVIAAPLIGQLLFNNADLTLVTQVAINEQTAETGNPNIQETITNWGTGPGTVKRNIKFTQSNNSGTFAEYQLTAATDNGAWQTLDVTYVDHNGTFTNGEPITVDGQGATGAGVAGPPGPNVGLDYAWNTATSGDPGTGKALVNAGSTILSISKTNRQGASNATEIASWDNSTNPSNRGHIRVVDVAAAGTNFRDLHVSGTITDQGTYYDIPVTSFEDEGTLVNDVVISVAFSPAGDKGLDGAGAGDVVGPASSVGNEVPIYANTTGKLLGNSPLRIDPANGNVTGVGTLTASGAITSSDKVSGTDVTGTGAVTGDNFQATGQAADKLSAGTTAQRPSAPVAGEERFNTTDKVKEYYNDTVWVQLAGSSALPSGSIVNSVYAEYTASVALSTVLPADDTIPQNTEGTQIISMSITPSASANKIRARFQAWGTMDGIGTMSAALFQDAIVNALAAGATGPAAADNRVNIGLEFEHSPATTSSVTYAIRIGPNAGNAYLNGLSTGRRFGGTSRATLVLEEIKA